MREEVGLGVVADGGVRILVVVVLLAGFVAGVEEMVMGDGVLILELVLLVLFVSWVEEMVMSDGVLILELVLLVVLVAGVEDLRIYDGYAGIRGVFLVLKLCRAWEARKIAKMGRGCVSAASAFFPSAFESRTLQNLKDEKRS